MTIQIYDDQIQSVNKGGIIYLDGSGVEREIIFEKCYQICRGMFLSPDNKKAYLEQVPFSEDELIESLNKRKTIGESNSSGDDWKNNDHPYIDFFTEPPIRMIFANKKTYYVLLLRIKQHGYVTEDIT